MANTIVPAELLQSSGYNIKLGNTAGDSITTGEYNITICNYLFLIYLVLLYKSIKLCSFIFRINLNIFIFIEKILHFYI